MSVIINGVQPGSPAAGIKINIGDILISINDNEIMDVLDYRFYQNEINLKLKILNKNNEELTVTVHKDEYEELGFIFDTYLMDKQKRCRNKCVFCFIDQLPPGLRESLYFKDDDSRLSFLFGNYITLTNITEHEVARIIKMHISPINISVHTTNPELRVKMMKNRFSGDVLGIIKRFSDAGIAINCQLVLCPGFNDGIELERSLKDLTSLGSVMNVAAVPVGLTKFRDGLEPLILFNKNSASEVLDTIEGFGEKCKQFSGFRKVFAADEFYLLAERVIPNTEYYEDFVQLENGVGLCSLFRSDAMQALDEFSEPTNSRNISCVTGTAAYPIISNIVDMAAVKWHNLNCKVYPIKNEFFGETISVAGLITGKDIISQLKDRDLGEELLLPSVMLRSEGDMLLDNTTPEQLEEQLKVKVRVVDSDGDSFISALAGEEVI